MKLKPKAMIIGSAVLFGASACGGSPSDSGVDPDQGVIPRDSAVEDQGITTPDGSSADGSAPTDAMSADRDMSADAGRSRQRRRLPLPHIRRAPHNHTKATWRCIAFCSSRRQDEVSVWEASVRSQPARTRTLKQDVCAA